MIQQVFPPAPDDGCEPFRQIADHQNCTEHAVLAAFNGLLAPEWVTPGHLRTVKKTAHYWNEASRHARNLHGALMRLHEDDRGQLQAAGAATVEQISHLQAVLSRDAQSLEEWMWGVRRSGRENSAASTIAEGMRRLFRRRRQKITFGQHPDGGPSTEFGRAVEFAIGTFGVVADWRRPTQNAKGKQDAIAGRLIRISMSSISRSER
jgi:hypothetical protein